MNWISFLILGIALIVGTLIYIIPSEEQFLMSEDAYWGFSELTNKIDESIRPFKIKFTNQMIDDLKHRLNNTRKPQPPIDNAAWNYGVNSNYMPTIINYWLNKYDFVKRETYLNQYPQFLTNVQGLDIHFVRVKPKVPKDRELKILPILILHGWPGSIVEFHKIIPLLTTPRSEYDFVFEVIAPSLPGFGYSTATTKPDFGALEMAQVLKNLMLRLGYDKYYVHGGDWGAMVNSYMAAMFPEHILGIHLNLCIVVRPWTLVKTAIYNMIPWMMSHEEQEMSSPLSYQLYTLITETGYYHLQATKPDTIGIGLSDSPAGLAAYVLEKFSSITKKMYKLRDDCGLLEKFHMDELIDNLMMYWVPNKITSSFRIYAESTNIRTFKKRTDKMTIKVPSACAQFPHEIMYQPESLLRDRFHNLVRVTRMKRGGHFAALEEPELLAEDMWSAVPLMNATRENMLLQKNCFEN